MNTDAMSEIRFRERRQRDKARIARLGEKARRQLERDKARLETPCTIRLPFGVTLDLQAARMAGALPHELVLGYIRALLSYGRRAR